MPPNPPPHPPPPPQKHPLAFVPGNADTVTVSIHYFRIAHYKPCLPAPSPPPLLHTHTGCKLLHCSVYATIILCSDWLVFISEGSVHW